MSGPWPAHRRIHGGIRRPLSPPYDRAVRLIDKVAAPFWDHPILFLLLAGLAVWAGLWGFTSFYGGQYARTPWYVWPFVPDSPLATTAWLIGAIAIKRTWDRRSHIGGRAWAFFINWAAMMNIKVGIWTDFVLLYHYGHFFSGTIQHVLLQWMLIASHAGMVGLAVLLLRKGQAIPTIGYLALLVLGLLWDFIDYGLAPLLMPGSGITIYPNGVPPRGIEVVAIVTVTLTVVATSAVALVMRRRGPPVDDGTARE